MQSKPAHYTLPANSPQSQGRHVCPVTMLRFDAPAPILNSNSPLPPDAAGQRRRYGLPLLAADRPQDSGSFYVGRDSNTIGGAGQQPSGGEATMEEQQLRALLHDLDALKQRPDDPASIYRMRDRVVAMLSPASGAASSDHATASLCATAIPAAGGHISWKGGSGGSAVMSASWRWTWSSTATPQTRHATSSDHVAASATGGLEDLRSGTVMPQARHAASSDHDAASSCTAAIAPADGQISASTSRGRVATY
ncbi:hypothetical protein SETIT_2G173500v2 [Setaria italica]|uniref:Uncharacterized protein n=1 Tax=Setaria italica TaxID=4555 RepID=A0A368Q230_SETIT|nr:hypothetical protein SETIT_2G173500v2 [Setaria italica]